MRNKIESVFKQHFSKVGKALRPEQIETIASVVSGKNTLCLMPTGAGKSLCYWVAGKILGGTTVVVSPLTALMDEQALKLSTDHSLQVAVFHSGVPNKLQIGSLKAVYSGKLPDFIFLSPERLATDGLLEYTMRKIANEINLFVIDEIHCVSQWGSDFRPFYKEIPYSIGSIFQNDHKPTILGLTATLNPKDKEEICSDFSIAPDNIITSKFLLRLGISTNVVKVKDEDEKDILLWKLLDEHKDEKILIYLDRKNGKRSTEELSAKAISLGYSATYFHSELSSSSKAEIISDFKTGKVKFVFATNAFGMGIDVQDIRGVIHYLIPESTEQYYQQIGRAGRDGHPAWATLFYSDKNISVRKTHFIDRSFPDIEEIKQAFKTLSGNQTNLKTFIYFEEDDTKSAYHYLLRSDAIHFLSKGIQNIKVYEKVKNVSLPKFDEYVASSKTGIILKIVDVLNISVVSLLEDIFRWFLENQIEAVNTPAKCLVIKPRITELPEDLISFILNDISTKCAFRHERLDQFVILLNGYSNSMQFQQEIGKYLGIDKFQLGKIHQTLSGCLVRSKSEVIICNILHERNKSFEYEKMLYAKDGSFFCPDFTIFWKGKEYYWEHLGLLDYPDYRAQWEIKKNWYNKNFPGQLVTTEESSILSKTAETLIANKFS